MFEYFDSVVVYFSPTRLKPVKEPETETITQIMALSRHSKAHANSLFHFVYFEIEETQTHSQSTIYTK